MRLLLLLPFLLFACTPDKEIQPTYQPLYSSDQLVGTWKMMSQTSSEPYAWYGFSGQSTSLWVGSNACGAINLFVLRADGSASITYCNTTHSGARWELRDDVFYYKFGAADPWTMSGRVRSLDAGVLNTAYLATSPTGSSTTINSVFHRQ